MLEAKPVSAMLMLEVNFFWYLSHSCQIHSCEVSTNGFCLLDVLLSLKNFFTTQNRKIIDWGKLNYMNYCMETGCPITSVVYYNQLLGAAPLKAGQNQLKILLFCVLGESFRGGGGEGHKIVELILKSLL